MAGVRRGRGQLQHITSDGGMPMLQQTVQPRDAALTRFQELTQLFQQRRERREDRPVMIQLVQQFATTFETLAFLKARAEIRGATGETIEHGELRFAEASRESAARQT